MPHDDDACKEMKQRDHVFRESGGNIGEIPIRFGENEIHIAEELLAVVESEVSLFSGGVVERIPGFQIGFQ